MAAANANANVPPPPPPPWLRRARVVNLRNGLSYKPFRDGPDGNLRDYLAESEAFDEEQNTLDLLQRSPRTNLSMEALRVILTALIDTLPQAVQQKVGLYTGDEWVDYNAGLRQPHWIFLDDADAFENLLGRLLDTSWPALGLDDKEFIFWLVNIGARANPHYATIVLHMEITNIVRGEFDRVGNWAIVDAINEEGHPNITSRARDRMARLLRDHGNPHDNARHIQVPPLEVGDEFATGFLAYAVISQLLDRISVMHFDRADFNSDSYFAPTHPWFNSDAVRAEALGRVAVKVMEKLHNKARVGLFPIRQFQDDEGQLVDPRDIPPGSDRSDGTPAGNEEPDGTPERNEESDESSEESEESDDHRDNEGQAGQQQQGNNGAPGDQDNQGQAGQQQQGNNGAPGGQDNQGQAGQQQQGNNGAPGGQDNQGQAGQQQQGNNGAPGGQNNQGQAGGQQQGDADPPDEQLNEQDRAIKAALNSFSRVAEEAVVAAEAFANRLQGEVLQAPRRNIPTAYALEALIGLIRRAKDRCWFWLHFNAHMTNFCNRPGQPSPLGPLFRRHGANYNAITRRLGHLRTIRERVLAARGGIRVGELAEPDNGEADSDDDEGGGDDGGDGGGGGGGGDGGDEGDEGDDGEDDGGDSNDDSSADTPSSPGPPDESPGARLKRRHRDYSVESGVDSDGEKYYTVDVTRKRRKR